MGMLEPAAETLLESSINVNKGTEKHALKSAGLITVTSGTLKALVKIMIVDTPAKDTNDLFDRAA